MPTYTSTGENGDVILARTMPEAEYMYGCTPTAVAMILGYYDLYGYRGTGLSNMIEGDVDSKSRGTDGNAYDMNAFDTVLGRATATESFVSRFHSRDGKDTTPSQELKYSFKSDNRTIDTDVWDCIADYLGTGQFWRGNENLSTTVTYSTLEELLENDNEVDITNGSTTRTIRYLDTSMLYGLDLYVQSRGYAMDYEITGSYLVDVAGGSFTFADYMREIDAGRPVVISIQGHSMTGYGYNADTQELIFDDCYVSGRRMKWGGTYYFNKAERKLQAITVIGINVNGNVDLALETIPGSTWEKLIVAGNPGAQENADYCFAGTGIHLNYTVSNLGTEISGDFSVSVLLDGETVSSGTLAGMDGGTSRTMTDIPLGELSVGMHNVRVILDEANEIQELSGRNNAASTDILILKSGTSIVSSTRLLEVGSGETILDVYVQGGGQLSLTGGQAFGTILRGSLTEVNGNSSSWIPAQGIVSEGGYASGADVYGYAELTIQNGGSAASVRIHPKGTAYIQNGGTVRDAAVVSGGRLTVYSGGTLTGRIEIADGASARINNGGTVDFDLSSVAPGATARVNDLSSLKGTPVYTLTVSGSQENGVYRLADGADGFAQDIALLLADGGVTLGTLSVGGSLKKNGFEYTLNLIDDALTLAVSGSASADIVPPTVSNVRADVTAPTCLGVTVTADFADDKALASALYRIGANGDWTAYDGGVTVHENTVVYFKAVDAAGNESEIASCSVSNITSSGCVLSDGQIADVPDGSVFTDTVLSGGSMFVLSGGAAFGTGVVAGGRMYVSSGGTAIGTTLDSGGDLALFHHASATVTAVNDSGYVDVCSGAVADGVAVGNGGRIVVCGGGTLTGRISFEYGANVSFEPQSILDFDLSALRPGADARVDGLPFIHGTPDYTLTISGSQTKGLYVLADGAPGFDSTISIRDASGSQLGTLAPGETADIGGTGYSLNLADGALTLTAGAAGVANGADIGRNNWLYDKKTKTTNASVRESVPAELNAGTTEILLDAAEAIGKDGRHNFVGFCDEADFAKITLESAAKLSFTVSATDAAKFIVYSLTEGTDKKGNPTYKLRAIQTTTLSKKKSFTASTKPLLLEHGDYYIAMQSTNAKKNGSAYYDVTLNRDDGATVFFSDGDDGANDWLYDKKTKTTNASVRDAAGIALKSGSIRIDTEAPSGEGSTGWENFVGFGDTADFAKLDISETATVSFTVSATDAAKFIVYSLTEGTDKKGNPTYKLKAVQTKTLKKQKGETNYTGTTNAIRLPAAENCTYYIAMQAAAQKGKSAFYNVSLNASGSGSDACALSLPSAAQDACAPVMPGLSGPETLFEDCGRGLLAGL